MTFSCKPWQISISQFLMQEMPTLRPHVPCLSIFAHCAAYSSVHRQPTFLGNIAAVLLSTVRCLCHNNDKHFILVRTHNMSKI